MLTENREFSAAKLYKILMFYHQTWVYLALQYKTLYTYSGYCKPDVCLCKCGESPFFTNHTDANQRAKAGETPGTLGETLGTRLGETPGTLGETPGTRWGETPGTRWGETPGTRLGIFYEWPGYRSLVRNWFLNLTNQIVDGLSSILPDWSSRILLRSCTDKRPAIHSMRLDCLPLCFCRVVCILYNTRIKEVLL